MNHDLTYDAPAPLWPPFDGIFLRAIGLDCGTSTGFAEYVLTDHEYGCITEVCSLDFWRAFDRVSGIRPRGNTLIVVEDVSANDTVWHHGANKRAMAKVGQNVGRVKRESELMIEGLRREGFSVWARPPLPKVGGQKVKGETFKRITGYEGRTNQHGRDAGLLVHGVTVADLKKLNRQAIRARDAR